MTEAEAIELARAAATRTADWPYHEYQPTPEQARDWMPHDWVVRAIMAASVPAFPSGGPGGGGLTQCDMHDDESV